MRDNYEKVVNDAYKHVIIAFVTDWCEHCKEVTKMYEDVKKNLNDDVTDIVFAKANPDKNDFGFRLKNFPTIRLYKKDDKVNFIEYDMIRDYEVLLNFLEEKLGRTLYQKKMPEEMVK